MFFKGCRLVSQTVATRRFSNRHPNPRSRVRFAAHAHQLARFQLRWQADWVAGSGYPLPGGARDTGVICGKIPYMRNFSAEVHTNLFSIRADFCAAGQDSRARVWAGPWPRHSAATDAPNQNNQNQLRPLNGLVIARRMIRGGQIAKIEGPNRGRIRENRLPFSEIR